MKRFFLCSVLILIGSLFPAEADILVDDTWADGTRNDQNLPVESAWFTSSAANMSAGVGFLSVTNLADGTSSSQWTTYFTPSGSPVQLNVGDTLTVTLEFVPNGVNATNTSQNFRIGLVNSSGGTRLTGDGGPNAVNYTGYAMFGNFGQYWGRGGGIDFKRRNNLANSNLLGTSSDWGALGSGGTPNGTIAFSNGVPYALVITLTRDTESTMQLTATYSGGDLTNSFTASDLTGNIYTNFDTLVIRPSGATTTATNFVFTRFKVEGPAGLPQPPAIVSEPQGQTLTISETALITAAASGGAPLHYQWYSVDRGLVPQATNATLILSNIQTNQAGDYYVVVTNSQGAATSQVANLTITIPVFTAPGVVVDDVWADGVRNDPPVTPSNSVWYASASGSLLASPGSMLGLPSPTTSSLWIGYFTEDWTLPIDIAVGNALKITLVFTPTNVAPQNNSTLRFGLFNYSAGAVRITGDDFGSGSSGNGVNVRGYMFQQNFGTTLGDTTPMEIRARNNLGSGDLLGGTGDYVSLGSGPSVASNAPGFQSGTQYTLELTVRRVTESSMEINSRMTGAGMDLSFSATDNVYGYRRFDAFALRPNRTIDSAEQLNITQFKVEVIEPSALFRILGIERLNSDSVKLTWESILNGTYQVQSRDSLSSGNWVTNGTISASGISSAFTNSGIAGIPQRFYRVVKTQ